MQINPLLLIATNCVLAAGAGFLTVSFFQKKELLWKARLDEKDQFIRKNGESQRIVRQLIRNNARQAIAVSRNVGELGRSMGLSPAIAAADEIRAYAQQQMDWVSADLAANDPSQVNVSIDFITTIQSIADAADVPLEPFCDGPVFLLSSPFLPSALHHFLKESMESENRNLTLRLFTGRGGVRLVFAGLNFAEALDSGSFAWEASKRRIEGSGGTLGESTEGDLQVSFATAK